MGAVGFQIGLRQAPACKPRTTTRSVRPHTIAGTAATPARSAETDGVTSAVYSPMTAQGASFYAGHDTHNCEKWGRPAPSPSRPTATPGDAPHRGLGLTAVLLAPQPQLGRTWTQWSEGWQDRKSTRLNSSHHSTSY